ncbi:Interferon-stimulated 20 kDa exonuclease-like 2-like [Arapaima gigas]
MSDIILNLDASHSDNSIEFEARRTSAGKIKHEKFLKRRKTLERRCLLRSKQNQPKLKKHQQASNKRPQKTDFFIHSRSSDFTTTASQYNQIFLKKPKQDSVGKPESVKNQDNKPKQDFGGRPKSMKNQKNSFMSNLHTHKCSNPNSSVSAKLVVPKSSSSMFTSSLKSSFTSIQSKKSNPTSTTTQSTKAQGASQSHGHTQPTPQVKFCDNVLKYLAIDCEMVGTGPKGCQNELARCSIVSYNGDVVYDRYIKPTAPVTDFRTRWSGITRAHLKNAKPFTQARNEILKILKGKVVVGHAIHNDFKSLSYSHPSSLTRDTSRIPLLNKKAGFPERQPASLKKLTKALLNRDIQADRSGHSSVEDARAAMELYKIVEVEWENALSCSTL